MAVINAHLDEADLIMLAQQLVKRLPFYVIPLFLRLSSTMEMTGTFKLIKYKLKNDGFNPQNTTDFIYFFDKTTNNYIKLTNEIFQRIESGLIKL